MLEQTEKHIAEGDQLVAKQKELIAELSSHGKDVTSYLVLLGRFQETQRLRIQHRDRLQAELDEFGADLDADSRPADLNGRSYISSLRS
jgi:hypothetical protein